jgi:hypothetical protein
MSVEIDVLPIAESNEETARLADLIEGVSGEFSRYEQDHGFSIDGVDLDTSALLDGWRDRLVRVQNANTAAPSGMPEFVGWCLDKDDLCVTKLCALRDKDETSSLRCSQLDRPTPPSSQPGSPRSPSDFSGRPSGRQSGSPLAADLGESLNAESSSLWARARAPLRRRFPTTSKAWATRRGYRGNC